MIKNLKVGLGLGVGFWAIMFIGVSAIMVMPISDLIQKIAEIILAGIAAFILAKLYFKKNPGDIKAGLILGVVWFIVSGILDLLVTIQYVKAGGSYVDGLITFYSSWNLWVGFLLMFVGTALAAQTTHGGDLMELPGKDHMQKQTQATQKSPAQPANPPTPPTPPVPPAQGGQKM
ncbi:MAG: hypothetical protein CMI53_01810 [Parcubacteria group bacterium]|nr:hypothetical protein [Parcubacteria group bacterium]|tara:strand:+ start:2852 stop:3376 length:525 start_codon:yes stop_codon:yes gene_type:complete